MSAPLVSFVVPCYNYGRFLPDCLNSIFGQEGEQNFEVIAVDDGSTDDTQEVLRSFVDPRLETVTHLRNRGHIATVNEGLSRARGTFVARIDPDDRYRPDFLSRTLEKFHQFPEVGLVYGDAAVMDDSGNINIERSDRVHGGADYKGNEFVRLLESNIICAPTAIARREVWQIALPIPAGLAFNDWYFNLMFARQFDFYYINRVLADYRVHAANHHSKIVMDGTEEASIFCLLDRIFSERENRGDLQLAKERAHHRVYAAQYLTSADKYFGAFMNRDARRCYLQAVRNRPSYLLRFEIQRRLLATIVGRDGYEAGKKVLKTIVARG
jgi:glycosyltransferase involved in cell wall biosynthesis